MAFFIVAKRRKTVKKIYHSMATRDEAIESIKAAGEYIADNAENILGEYPCGIVELSVNAKFDASHVLCVDVRRTHIVTGREDDA